MQPLSNDLRKRILDAVDNKEGSRRKLAARFKVNTSTVTKPLRLRRETGSFERSPMASIPKSLILPVVKTLELCIL